MTIADNLMTIRAEIVQLAEEAGRAPDSVKLVAVSKTKPVEIVREAWDAGQRIFGENRMQELETKVEELPNDIEWHLIGHLQGNKAVKAVQVAAWIHAVDSMKLLNRLERLAEENQKTPKILLQCNISGEETKFGLESETETMELAEAALKAEHLDFRGLMTMAPFGAEEHELRGHFNATRELRDTLETKLGTKLPELSMGMSSDYKEAIKEGATLVRIGTAIFGHRG